MHNRVLAPKVSGTHAGAPEDISAAKASSLSIASSDSKSKSTASDAEGGEPGLKRVSLINESVDIGDRTFNVVRPERTRNLQLTERIEEEGYINIVDVCVQLPGRYGGSVSVAQFINSVEAVYKTDDEGNETLTHFEIAGNATEALLFMPSISGKGYFKLQVELEEILELQKDIDNRLSAAPADSSQDMNCGVDFTILEPVPQVANLTKDAANQAGVLLASGKDIAANATTYVSSLFFGPQKQKPQSTPPVQTQAQTAQVQEPEEPDTPDLRLRKVRIPSVSDVSSTNE